MIDGKTVLAVIPARGGSKGIHKKNITPIAGKPLIAWTIIEAKKSQYIDDLILSSDDPEIIDTAYKYGCAAPFIRPKELAADTSSSMDVVLHAIAFMSTLKHFDLFMLLEPTSPLRTIEDIDTALEILSSNSNAESIVGVSRVENVHPSFLVRINKGVIEPYSKSEYGILRRQELETLYFYEGSIYGSYIQSLKNRKSFYHNACLAYEVPRWKSFEVDNPEDLIIIEALLNAREQGVLK